MKCAVWCWLSSDSNWCKTRFCHLLVVWLLRGFIAWTVYKLLCLPQDLQLCPLRRVRRQIRFPPSIKTREIVSFKFLGIVRNTHSQQELLGDVEKLFSTQRVVFPIDWIAKTWMLKISEKTKILNQIFFINFTSDPQSFDQRT